MTLLPRQHVTFRDPRGEQRESYYARHGFRGVLLFIAATPGGQAGWWVEEGDVVAVGDVARKRKERSK